jgi:AraC-like DNA-binding protein
MRFEKILPSLKLQPFVKFFWFLEVSESDIPFSQHLLPYSCCQLFFQLEHSPEMHLWNGIQDKNQFDSIFSGQFTKSIFLNYTKPSRCVGISLQPWTGNSLFDYPANHFTDCLIHTDHFDKQSRLREQLLGVKNENEILMLLEQYLLEKLKNHHIDQLSTVIAKAILKKPTVSEYKNIVSTIGFTRRRVEQRFLESIGVSMGTFVRKIRFEKALQLLGYSNQLSLTQMGLEADYYDQSHFIREFKEYSSITPMAFLKQAQKMDRNTKELIIG